MGMHHITWRHFAVVILSASVAIGLTFVAGMFFATTSTEPVFPPAPRPRAMESAAFARQRSSSLSIASRATTTTSTQPVSSVSPSTPILSEVFVNERYHYAFRYPPNLAVRDVVGDGRVVTVLLNGMPLLSFSIISRDDEQQALDRAVLSIRTTLDLQDEHLNRVEHGQQAVAIDISPVTITPFLAKPEGRPGVLGFSLTGGLSGLTRVFLRLYDQHCLKIDEHERLGELPGTYAALQRTILNSFDPYQL